jgi:hypothetical protein
MAFSRTLSLAICGFALTACGDPQGIGGGNEPATKFVTLSINGDMPDQNFAIEGGAGSGEDLQIVEGQTTGYAFAHGVVDGTNTYLGVAGIAPNSTVGNRIEGGSVAYSGTYSLAHANESNTTDENGNISLTANFIDDGGTVTGSTDGFEVYGTFKDTDNVLGGTVVHDGIVATLTGRIGTEAVAGAFVGNSNDEVLVGGIYVTAD